MDFLNSLTSRFNEVVERPEVKRAKNSLSKAFDDFNKLLDDFPFDEYQNKFDSFMSDISKKFDDFKEEMNEVRVHRNLTVDYDRNTDKLEAELNDNVFTVVVSKLDGTASSTKIVTVPQDAKLEKSYNAEEKKMTFRFMTEPTPTTEEQTEEEEQAEDEFEEFNGEEDAVNTPEEQQKNKVAMAVKLHKEGWSFRRIAKEVGVSDKTVARWVRKAAAE